MAIISTFSKIVSRCPSCGDISYHDLSMFSFSRSRSTKLECTCGKTIVYMGTKDRKHYWLQLECSFCEGRHIFYYHWKDLWNGDVLSLVCDESGLDIAYIGPEKKIEKAIEDGEKSLAKMAEDLGFGDYFTNPEVMYGVLDYLNQLAEDGSLFCQCGNFNIEIEIYPDRLELRCEYCDCSGIIMAQNEMDLETVRSLSEIQLTNRGFKCLEGKKVKPRKRFKK